VVADAASRVEPRTSETVFTSCSVKSLPPVMLKTMPVARSMERWETSSAVARPDPPRPRIRHRSAQGPRLVPCKRLESTFAHDAAAEGLNAHYVLCGAQNCL
jgi:hypothetical protein